MATTLWARFEQLAASLSAAQLPAIPLDGTQHYVARGTQGEPILLLAILPRPRVRIPLQLKNVLVEFDVACRLYDEGGGQVEGRYLKLSCDPGSPGLHEYFVRATAGLVEAFQTPLSAEQADHFVSNCAALFAASAQPAKSTLIGLWGELFVIHEGRDKESLMAAWHAAPTDATDFVGKGFLEVKTTESKDRIHEVALEQVRPASGRDGYVVSVLVERTATGCSVFELSGMIAPQLSRESERKLWRLVAETLGTDVDTAGDVRFDVHYSRSQLRAYEARKLPAPVLQGEALKCVSAVRYRIDFCALPWVPDGLARAEDCLRG